MFTNRDFMDQLMSAAKAYRPDAAASLKRNEHMHKLRAELPQEAIDAVLTDFINCVAARRGMDYGLYAEDFERG